MRNDLAARSLIAMDEEDRSRAGSLCAKRLSASTAAYYAVKPGKPATQPA
jgi:hypothetical protein